MWIHNDTSAFAPELRASKVTTANGTNGTNWRISWNDAWQAITEALRPFPDAAKALLPLVNRLLDECRTLGDPGRPNPEPPVI